MEVSRTASRDADERRAEETLVTSGARCVEFDAEPRRGGLRGGVDVDGCDTSARSIPRRGVSIEYTAKVCSSPSLRTSRAVRGAGFPSSFKGE